MKIDPPLNTSSAVPFFQQRAQSGQARCGVMHTAHGAVQTPVFMPVGTRGSVKCLWQEDLEEMGAEIILGNTYHLYLRPGHQLIEKTAGDLHNFISWKKPILTDSGGFQVFSLKKLRKISDSGVEFRSHIDGSRHTFTPEVSMEIQRALGSDVVMVFDECPALPASKQAIAKSMELTLNWAKSCRQYSLRPYQKLFGIIQGGVEADLRVECAQRLVEMNFEGLAIGGLSVGESAQERARICEAVIPHMPQDKPRYLMGVGTPLDILMGIKQGIDMFDCVLPTRNARNGQALTHFGPLNLKNAQFKEDPSPLDPLCKCRVCLRYTRRYIRHLISVGEYLGAQLISYHNLAFYHQMVAGARSAIIEGNYHGFYQQFVRRYSAGILAEESVDQCQVAKFNKEGV